MCVDVAFPPASARRSIRRPVEPAPSLRKIIKTICSRRFTSSSLRPIPVLPVTTPIVAAPTPCTSHRWRSLRASSADIPTWSAPHSSTHRPAITSHTARRLWRHRPTHVVRLAPLVRRSWPPTSACPVRVSPVTGFPHPAARGSTPAEASVQASSSVLWTAAFNTVSIPPHSITVAAPFRDLPRGDSPVADTLDFVVPDRMPRFRVLTPHAPMVHFQQASAGDRGVLPILTSASLPTPPCRGCARPRRGRSTEHSPGWRR